MRTSKPISEFEIFVAGFTAAEDAEALDPYGEKDIWTWYEEWKKSQ